MLNTDSNIIPKVSFKTMFYWILYLLLILVLPLPKKMCDALNVSLPEGISTLQIGDSIFFNVSITGANSGRTGAEIEN